MEDMRPNDSRTMLQAVQARLQDTITGVVQVVCQLDRKDEAPIHDVEDLALQTQLQMGDILAAVTENLQIMDRQMQAEEGKGLLNDICKEVADEITIARTHGLQLSDLIQEGWGNSGTEALAAAISDVRSMRAEVQTVWKELAQHATRLSAVLESEGRADIQCSEQRDILQAREITLEDYMHFHADIFAALEQGIRKTFEELEEDWDSVCTKERDSFKGLLEAQLSQRQMLNELRWAVADELSSCHLKICSLQAELHQQRQRAEADEEAHAEHTKTMLADELQHKQELQECRQELLAANGRVTTLQEELAMVNSPAGILMKHKQQAEASLKACMQDIACLQREAAEKESQLELQRQVLEDSECQKRHLQADFEASDLELQSARQQIATLTGKEAATLAEQRELTAVIRQQSNWMKLQADQSEEDRGTIVSHEACMQGAIEEMDMMCSSSRSATQAIRDSLAHMEATILVDMRLSRQEFAELRDFVERIFVHMQHMNHPHSMKSDEGSELSLREECQMLSAELFQSQQACKKWQKRCHKQEKEAERMKREYEDQLEAQSSANQALEEEAHNLKLAIANAEQQHKRLVSQTISKAEEDMATALKTAHDKSEFRMSQAIQDLTAEMQKDKEQEIQRCQASLQEKHGAELDQMEAALTREQQRHSDILLDLSARHELECSAVRQQAQHELQVLEQEHADALATIALQQKERLSAREAAAEKRLQSLLQQAEETSTHMMTVQRAQYEEQLTALQEGAERRLLDSNMRWQQLCHADREAAHAAKLDELAQLSTSHAATMADCQARHCQEVSELEDTIKILKEHLEQQRNSEAARQATHESMMEQAQSALASKESAMQAAAERHAVELMEQSAETARQRQSLANEHAREIEHIEARSRASALEKEIHAEAQMEDLEDQLAALKQRFEARESRREDAEAMKRLAQVVADRDAAVLQLQAELDKQDSVLQQLHREMVLREDNYNRKFAGGGAGMRALDERQPLNAQQSVVDWMLKTPASHSQKGRRK